MKEKIIEYFNLNNEQFISQYDFYFTLFLSIDDSENDSFRDVLENELVFLKEIHSYIIEKLNRVLDRQKRNIDYYLPKIENKTIGKKELKDYLSFVEKTESRTNEFVHKLKFIEYKISHLYYIVDESQKLEIDEFRKEIVSELNELKQNVASISVDNESNRKYSISQRLVILNELGVIDFLREKYILSYPNTTENQMSEILAIVLNEKHGTVSPYIRAIRDTDITNKNNPYSSEVKVNVVKELLIQKGFRRK